MPHISVVSPVYMAEDILPELVERISKSLKTLTEDFEIILVEDGSPDLSWEVIEQLSGKHPFVKGIKLSRNFGQHYAITAGLDHARGDWVVVMDCDLQDRPEEISRLYRKAREGFGIVLARRSHRKDRFLKGLSSKLFYRTLGYLTGSKQDETVANFGIYSKNVIAAVKSMREPIRSFPSMIKWVGFNTASVAVTHSKRMNGRSGYNLKKLLKLALDVILAYSDKPIRILIKMGLFIAFLSFVVAVVYLALWLKGEVVVLGYASLIISIWLLSGVLIAMLGIVGLYVGKTFEGVKNRPIYIIEKKTHND